MRSSSALGDLVDPEEAQPLQGFSSGEAMARLQQENVSLRRRVRALEQELDFLRKLCVPRPSPVSSSGARRQDRDETRAHRMTIR